MKKYKDLVKELNNEFTSKELSSSYLGAFFYTTIIAIPLLISIAQIVSVYLYWLTFWLVLIIIVMFLFNYIFHRLTLKALKLKKPETKVDIWNLFIYQQIIINIFFVIIGLIFKFILIPIWMV
jgi:hypothetical protein